MRRTAPARWLAVVPVKPLPVAKTRLRGAVPETAHPDLVLAMAQDTVAAALACPAVAGVLVVCDDPTVREALAALGAECVPDSPNAGLNAALTYGSEQVNANQANADQANSEQANADQANSEQGSSQRARVALTADLPALRPDELADALKAASEVDTRAFLPDAEGTGTVLLTAPAGMPLDPRFGPNSAAAHQASGARRLDGAWPSLRRDVDTAADLEAAKALGLGPHTESTLCAIASIPR